VLTLATAWDISSIHSLALTQIKDIYCEHSATLRQQYIAISGCDGTMLCELQDLEEDADLSYWKQSEFPLSTILVAVIDTRMEK
jgi:hypothetical protein